jgi:hypothetical protein
VGAGGREKGVSRGEDPGGIEAQNRIPPVLACVGGGEDRDGGAPGVAAGDFSGRSQEVDSFSPSAAGGRTSFSRTTLKSNCQGPPFLTCFQSPSEENLTMNLFSPKSLN